MHARMGSTATGRQGGDTVIDHAHRKSPWHMVDLQEREDRDMKKADEKKDPAHQEKLLAEKM